MMVHAYNSVLIADSGRFAYQGTDLSATLHREYSHNTEAHNTLTIDGTQQESSPPVATAPVHNTSWAFGVNGTDSAVGTMTKYAGLVGHASHTRAVHFDHAGNWFVVVDVIATDRPRTIAATWHCHPNASVDVIARDGAGLPGGVVIGGVESATGRPTQAQIAIIPASGGVEAHFSATSPSVVKGQVKNSTVGWQGWYSQDYDDAWAAPAISYTTSISAPTSTGESDTSTVFAWLLVPTPGRDTSVIQRCAVRIVSVSSTTATVAVTINASHTQSIDVNIASTAASGL